MKQGICPSPEFFAYDGEAFALPADPLSLPLPDEPFIRAWENYDRLAASEGTWTVLSRTFPQLRFPISQGVSESETYRAASRRGEVVKIHPVLELEKPGDLFLSLNATAAGKIPILIARHRPDFVALVRALAHRSEPREIPSSQGACMVVGFNNWDRINHWRRDWEKNNKGDWRAEFAATIKPRTELYQDRFVILSDGPYSGVPASDMGMEEGAWREASLVIRREHECAHYFTKRVLGAMRNHLQDEILADYMGITKAAGCFRADWFLQFFGLEKYPNYRRGGRLENYLGTPPLSEEAFDFLKKCVCSAADTLQQLEASLPESVKENRIAVLLSLAEMRLAEWTDPQVLDTLSAAVRKNAMRFSLAGADARDS